MQVRALRWVGVTTPRYAEMVTFCRDVLGLDVGFEEPTTTEFVTADGDAFQVMSPAHAYADLFGRYAGGPVPLFEVDDLDEARRDLESAGVELIGPTERDARWEWITLRAPDGHVYELGARRR